MPRLKLAVVLESFQLPLRRALQAASALGVAGVQMDAVGELAPDQLSQTGRKDLRHRLRSLGLELAAVGCGFRHGFDEPSHLEARIAQACKVLTLAYELGPRIAVAYPGAIPTQSDQPGGDILRDSLIALSRHADRIGATLALDNGTEPPAALADWLGKLAPGTLGGIGVAFDPATALTSGHDPAEATRAFHGMLRYAFARDARGGRGGRAGQEVPLGHGDIEWTRVLAGLEEIGYTGWLTIRRGPCPDPQFDIAEGVAFLRRLGV